MSEDQAGCCKRQTGKFENILNVISKHQQSCGRCSCKCEESEKKRCCWSLPQTAAAVIMALFLLFAAAAACGLYKLCFLNCPVSASKTENEAKGGKAAALSGGQGSAARSLESKKTAENMKTTSARPQKQLERCCSACQEKTALCLKNSENSGHIDIKANMKEFPKIDFAFKGSASQSRSDCFWLVIFFSSAALLALFLIFISYFSREKRLLRFFLEYKEIEKE